MRGPREPGAMAAPASPASPLLPGARRRVLVHVDVGLHAPRPSGAARDRPRARARNRRDSGLRPRPGLAGGPVGLGAVSDVIGRRPAVAVALGLHGQLHQTRPAGLLATHRDGLPCLHGRTFPQHSYGDLSRAHQKARYDTLPAPVTTCYRTAVPAEPAQGVDGRRGPATFAADSEQASVGSSAPLQARSTPCRGLFQGVSAIVAVMSFKR